MNERRVLGATLILLFCAACGDDAGGEGGSGSGSATSGSTESTASGTECPEVSDGPGGEACETDECPAGDYCEGFRCTPGCETASTCPEGQYCDLSGADSTNAGTCRPPPDDCTGGTPGATTGSGTPADCDDRCLGKLVDCDLAEQVDNPQAACAQICDTLNEDTLACLEDAACSSLQDGEECGVVFGD